jgi:hypothetical protein
MQEKLIDQIMLENGLILEIYDRSRQVAGDRWLVSFEARMDIAVTPEYFKGQGSENPSLDAIREAVGEQVTYHYEKSRLFIEEKQKDEVFKGIKERFLETTLSYFSSANFPRNIILSRYQQAQGASKPWSRQ